MSTERAWWWLLGLAGLACASGECEPRCNPTFSCTYDHHPPDDAGPRPVRTQTLPCSEDGSCRIVQIATGAAHACALRDDGRVVCWGASWKGQTGRPPRATPPASPDPVAVVSGIDDAIEIAVGFEHTCARRAGGEVLCWGANAVGQLGSSDAPATGIPTLVPGLPSADGLSLGRQHSCARSTGIVRCWGAPLVVDLPTPSPPTPLGGLFDAIHIASSSVATCGVRAGGGVVCAGADWLGDGREAPHAGSEGVSVMDLDDAEQLAAGPFHFCALRRTGALACWGRNDFGQLGDGTRERGLVPRPVLDLGATVIVAVTAGGSAPDSRSETAAHSCALDDGGVVRCWGSNDLGQLGDGTRDRRIRPVIAQLAGTERVVEVSAGGRYTCVRTERGLVRCFGASQPGLATEPLPDAGF